MDGPSQPSSGGIDIRLYIILGFLAAWLIGPLAPYIVTDANVGNIHDFTFTLDLPRNVTVFRFTYDATPPRMLLDPPEARIMSGDAVPIGTPDYYWIIDYSGTFERTVPNLVPWSKACPTVKDEESWSEGACVGPRVIS